MTTVKINGQSLYIENGATVLEAARKAGVEIPTLCHMDGYDHFTSCMVCVVKDAETGRLIPSCSTKVTDGMEIITDNEEVHESRRLALELLMGEHVGDCEGPCQRICPAHMNIPLMLRQIQKGQLHQALITVKERIPLPSVLGRICPAPCEKGCRRRQVDESVSICLLKRYVGDVDLKQDSPWLPEKKSDTGKKVAIVGAGPAGLSAAWYLTIQGHDCTLFDKREKPGGMMRYGVQEMLLPHDVLDAEIALVEKLGSTFKMNTKVDDFGKLASEYDAVILAVGKTSPEEAEAWGLESSPKGIHVDHASLMTSRHGVFAGGGALRPMKLAVMAVGHGWELASSVGRYLAGEAPVFDHQRLNSHVGKLQEREIAWYREAYPAGDMEHDPDKKEIDPAEAAADAARCLHCDCLKPDSCRLRDFAQAYDAHTTAFTGNSRAPIEKIEHHEEVLYEPGKCIKCGLCVRITQKHKERLGLTFIGRGFDVRVGVPLSGTLDKALEKVAEKVVEACPTGALAFKEKD